MKISVSKQNQKEINSLMLKHNGHVDVVLLDNADKLIAENIAYQCPFKGGKAVYDARGIVWKYNPGAKFSDELLCNNGAYFKEANNREEKINNDFISLAPNPAANKITLSYNLSGYKVCKLKIIDITGRIIKIVRLNNKQQKTEIVLAEFSEGIYSMRVIADDTEIKTLKFAVVK